MRRTIAGHVCLLQAWRAFRVAFTVSLDIPVLRLLYALRLASIAPMLACASGCAVVAVADAAVTVVAVGVKVAAKTVGVVADAVIPDRKEVGK